MHGINRRGLQIVDGEEADCVNPPFDFTIVRKYIVYLHCGTAESKCVLRSTDVRL
jgi:hypothetical protein